MTKVTRLLKWNFFQTLEKLPSEFLSVNPNCVKQYFHMLEKIQKTFILLIPHLFKKRRKT
jgi:hypothetical protein